MKILILGAGGIGGYFGGRLVQAGADVTFLVRPARKQQLQTHGLQIRSHEGDADLRVEAKLKSEIGSGYDLVMLTCKAYDLDDAIETIAPAVGGRTGVLPLLNGIAHLQVLNDRFGSDRVLGGTAKIAVTMSADGVIRHLNDWSNITFGEQNGELSARVKTLKSLFDKIKVDATASTDVRRDLWLKLVLLHTLAAMTSLLRANIGEIVRTADGEKLFRAVLETNFEIARREGCAPDEKFIAANLKLFSQADSTTEASLARDMERGGPIESDHILGFMLERCRAHGLDDHIHRLAYAGAKAYEQRRAAKRLAT